MPFEKNFLNKSKTNVRKFDVERNGIGLAILHQSLIIDFKYLISVVLLKKSIIKRYLTQIRIKLENKKKNVSKIKKLILWNIRLS